MLLWPHQTWGVVSFQLRWSERCFGENERRFPAKRKIGGHVQRQPQRKVPRSHGNCEPGRRRGRKWKPQSAVSEEGRARHHDGHHAGKQAATRAALRAGSPACPAGECAMATRPSAARPRPSSCAGCSKGIEITSDHSSRRPSTSSARATRVASLSRPQRKLKVFCNNFDETPFDERMKFTLYAESKTGSRLSRKGGRQLRNANPLSSLKEGKPGEAQADPAKDDN